MRHRMRQPPALLDQGQPLSDFQVHHLAKDLSAKTTNRPFAAAPVDSLLGAQQEVMRSCRLSMVELQVVKKLASSGEKYLHCSIIVDI